MLAYLKSGLLRPRTEKGKGGEMPAEEMAAALAFLLQKLEAMRKAVEASQIYPVFREFFKKEGAKAA